MIYKVALHRSEEGYSVSVPGLPGCCSQGATEAEALENIADAIREYLEVAAELAAEAECREVEVTVQTCPSSRASITSTRSAPWRRPASGSDDRASTS